MYLTTRNRAVGTNSIYTKEESPILSIDFGTTNSVIASYIQSPHKHGAIIIKTQDSLFYPSVALYNKEKDEFLTGSLAYKRRILNSDTIVTSIKRHLLRDKISVAGKDFSPALICQQILCGLLNVVKSSNPNAIPEIITLTHPYYFQQTQNLLLKNALEKAVFQVFEKKCRVELLPEPIASALYLISSLEGQGDTTTLIFDIGGGTFDLSIVHSVVTHSRIECKVIATGGCDKLGGDDIDQILFDYIIRQIGVDISSYSAKDQLRIKAMLLDAIIQAKGELTYSYSSDILCRIPLEKGVLDVQYVITRNILEDLLVESTDDRMSFVDKLLSCTNNMFVNRSRDQIDRVILVGGPTRMPIIRRIVTENFSNATIMCQDNDEDVLSVAKGAALYSAMLQSESYWPFGNNIKQISFKSCIPHSIYIEKYDGTLELLVKRGSICPAKEVKQFRPTKLSDDGLYLVTSKIPIYQEGEENQYNCVGHVNIPTGRVHTHGRKLDDIIITLQIVASASLIQVDGMIPQGNADMSNYQFKEIITI